ncbi:MAG TPA: nucleotidyl transferase AbiEii/AbiGii toxin family protein [Burkholderiales bacterium]
MPELIPFLSLSEEERQAAFEKAAVATGRSSQVLEKDFWVCWTLHRLFSLDEKVAPLTFKGGTSLSKAFRAIQRFSEDLDITIDHGALKLSGNLEDKTLSRTAVKKLIEEARGEASKLISGVIGEELRRKLKEQLRRGKWEVTVDANDPLTLLMTYPFVTGDSQTAYLRRIVRVEFCAHSPTVPSERHTIVSDIAAHFPSISFPQARAVVLSPVRTFWEKATLLHAEYHRPEFKGTQERLSRHWYDVAVLSDHEIGRRALAEISMLTRVAEDKDRLFHAGWASYATARPGTLRLRPHERMLAVLRDDFEKMKSERMFDGMPPTFDEILQKLERLESEIRKVASLRK